MLHRQASFLVEGVTYVFGIKCYPCAWKAPIDYWSGRQDLTGSPAAATTTRRVVLDPRAEKTATANPSQQATTTIKDTGTKDRGLRSTDLLSVVATGNATRGNRKQSANPALGRARDSGALLLIKHNSLVHQEVPAVSTEAHRSQAL